MQDGAYFNSRVHGFHEGKAGLDVPTKLMLIVTEISEAMEEYRTGRNSSETYYTFGKPMGLPSELADAIIRIGDLAGILEIDLESIVQEKMKYNATRTHMHGGKAC